MREGGEWLVEEAGRRRGKGLEVVGTGMKNKGGMTIRSQEEEWKKEQRGLRGGGKERKKERRFRGMKEGRG